MHFPNYSVDFYPDPLPSSCIWLFSTSIELTLDSAIMKLNDLPMCLCSLRASILTPSKSNITSWQCMLNQDPSLNKQTVGELSSDLPTNSFVQQLRYRWVVVAPDTMISDISLQVGPPDLFLIVWQSQKKKSWILYTTLHKECVFFFTAPPPHLLLSKF